MCNKYNMKYLFLFFFILLSISVVSAKKLDSLNTVEADTTFSRIKSNTDTIDYKLLYENQKEHNREIISTVYWALSSILLIILAIIGSNVFFNFRFNKKQYQELEGELTKNITEQINKFKEVSAKKIEEYINETQKLYSENFKELSNDFKERLESVSVNLIKQIDATKTLFDNKNNHLLEKIIDSKNNIKDLNIDLGKHKSESIEFVNKQILETEDRILKQLKYEDNRIKYELYNTNANVWKLRGVHQNALRYFIDEAIVLIELGWNNNLHHSISYILEVLEDIDYIYNAEFKAIKLILEKTPDKFLELKQKVKDRLTELEVRE